MSESTVTASGDTATTSVESAPVEPATKEKLQADLLDAIGKAIVTLTPNDDQLALVRSVSSAEDVIRELSHQAVSAARAAGHSWASIGNELGMSRQAVQQRFGDRTPAEPTAPRQRWLGPVTAFDEMAELDLAGRRGWHTIQAGMLRHLMVHTDTQWEHRRVIWTGSTKRHETDGWVVGCRALPWIYLIRDTGRPAED